MANPLARFVSEGRRLTDLVGSVSAVSDAQLPDFMANKRRLEFLRDIVSRGAVLAYCYDAICALSARWNNLQERIHNLPTNSNRSNVRTIPQEFVDEEERWLVEIDAFTSLIYYEVTSVIKMLGQLKVAINPASEVQYLVKVRDRFLSHVQLSSVARDPDRGWHKPKRGFIERDVVSLSSWTSSELRELDEHALKFGSPEWKKKRRQNEKLVLSKKRNEDLTKNELLDLMVAGVRECRLELALNQLATLMESDVLPIIEQETRRAIEEFGWERWTNYG